MAALEVVRSTLAVPYWQLDGPKIAFLVYYLAFRLKMYMDDSNHEFSVNNPLDVLAALLSWLAFLISVAAVSKGVNLAIGWFMFGLVVSTVWIPVSAFGNRNPDWVRYGWFALMNVVQVLGLGAV